MMFFYFFVVHKPGIGYIADYIYVAAYSGGVGQRRRGQRSDAEPRFIINQRVTNYVTNHT